MANNLANTFNRAELYEEFHRRSPVPMSPDQTCSHFTLRAEDERRAFATLESLCNNFGITPPNKEERQFIGGENTPLFKWERHTEFWSYTFYANSDEYKDAIDMAPKSWREAVSGDILTAVHIAISAGQNDSAKTLTPPYDVFSSTPIAGGLVCDGHAVIWSDFALYEDGFSRITVVDRGLGPKRAGRLVQRLIDLETYRIAALLGLDEAHKVNKGVDEIEASLHYLLEHHGFNTKDAPDRELLESLLTLASRTEELLSKSSFRFDATSAYAKLVFRRLEELNEGRIQGAQRLSNFIKRRFLPAVETCDAASTRLQGLTARVHRDATLIRTRIEMSRQEQNNMLLESMNRRAHLQYKLQQTVEAISSVAISYYAISIFAIFAKSAATAFPQIKASILTGIAAPFIILAVGLLVHRIHSTALEIDSK